MPLAKDIWRPCLVDAPIERIWRAGSLDGIAAHPLSDDGFMRFSADPFGIERDGQTTVFVEAYDYRTRHGVIDAILLDAAGSVTQRRTVLREPWHLSYPFVFEQDGAIWMLPEASRSGRLTLYRACAFPWEWERAMTIPLPRVAIDATPLFHDGLWWLFHAARETDPMGALHLSFAEHWRGPWFDHPANPVRTGRDASRPGGTPTLMDGAILLPMQDCTRSYGGALRPLRIERLTPEIFEARAGEALVPPPTLAPYTDGLHTMAALGARTLIDVKRSLLSPRSLMVLATRGRRIG